MYQLNVFRLISSFDDELYSIKEAERINNVWRSMFLLTLFSLFIYIVSSYFGIGSQLILDSRYQFSADMYESNKFWFIIGRGLYSIIFAIVIIFLPALIYKWLFSDFQFMKLVTMQLGVLLILLIERLTWIPLMTLFSLDWYVSPLSLGVIVSYMTSKTWIIYFFGSISIFQLFIIYFQIKFLSRLVQANRAPIIVSVIFLNFTAWWLNALMTFISPYIVEGWF